LKAAIHTFYAMMGWDKKTGIPTEETLGELDISWVSNYLPV
jgi:aldehyde:ferredoxin oxidoreductase